MDGGVRPGLQQQESNSDMCVGQQLQSTYSLDNLADLQAPITGPEVLWHI